MGESLRVTIVYEPGEDGSIVASIPEVHSAHGQAMQRRNRAVVRRHLRELRQGQQSRDPSVAFWRNRDTLQQYA
jgi:hypothetical protein